MPRQLEFSQETADLICDRLIEGESLRKICTDEPLPSAVTVCRWLEANEGFRKQYARARDAQADNYADRIVDEALISTDAQLGRLKMDALKWAASKLSPKRYGDKLDVAHEGGLTINIKRFSDEGG